MKTKKLLFVGNYGNKNTGDDALLYVLSNRYKNKFTEHEQYCFARHYPEDIEMVSNAKGLSLNLKNILWVLWNVDVVVIGGGGLFAKGMGPLAKLISGFAIVCKLIGKRVVFDSVAIYSDTAFLQKLMLNIALLVANKVSVREECSIENTKLVRKFRDVKLVEDPGFSMKPDRNSSRLEKLIQKEKITLDLKKKLVGIAPRRLNNSEMDRALVQILSASVRDLNSRGLQVVFIPFCRDGLRYSEQDFGLAKEIIEKSNVKKGVWIIKNYYHPLDILDFVNACDLFIGMRFHSQIFAYVCGVRQIAVMVAQKGKQLFVSKKIDVVDFSHSINQKLYKQVFYKYLKNI